MARCCDPFDNEQRKNAIHKTYLLGGLKACDACKVELEEALSLIDGITEARVSLKDSTLEISYIPDRVPEGHLLSTLNGLGYSVREEIFQGK